MKGGAREAAMARTSARSPTPPESPCSSSSQTTHHGAIALEEEGGGQEGHGFAPSDGPNKSEAARQAIKAGYDKPAEALPWIKKMFGIEMGGRAFFRPSRASS